MIHSLPPLRLLQTFASIVRTGSIQITAAELNVTQPAVSQAVKQLEEHIGVRLLDRRRRPARLTPAGENLAEAVVAGLEHISEAIEATKRTDLLSAQAVTIACSVGVATYWLMPLLGRFYEDHPEIAVNVITTQLGAPELSDGIDLAVRYGHGRWTDGVVEKLFDEVVQPVCAPSLLSNGAKFSERLPLLHVRSLESSWLSWADYCRRTKLALATDRGQIFTNYVQATQAAMAGRGVMLGWRSITHNLVETGQLVSVGLPKYTPSDGFFLVGRSQPLGAAAELFSGWLAANGKQSATKAWD